MPSFINDIGQELLDSAQYTVSSIFPAILVVILFIFAWWVVGKLLPTGVPDTWHIWLSVIAWALRLCFLVLSFSLVLDALGLDANSIVATLIAFTFPSAWVFSEPLKNFIAAFFVRFSLTKETRIGSYLRISSEEGTVKKKTLQYVNLVRGDGSYANVPNIYFLNRVTENGTPESSVERNISSYSNVMKGIGGVNFPGTVEKRNTRHRQTNKDEENHFAFHAFGTNEENTGHGHDKVVI